MKANELRIGNYVTTSGEFGQWSQTVIVGPAHFQMTCGKTIYCESFEPIPLTEDILLKCGFSKDIKNNDIEYKLNDSFSIWRKDRFDVFYLCQYNEISKCLINTTQIKHLYQLQNLYWCLCGEELKINL